MGLKGFMPFDCQWGFVFVPSAGTDAVSLSRTAAHEVAHVREAMQVQARGAAAASSRTIPTFVGSMFNLRHTFSPENDYQLSDVSTDNLMFSETRFLQADAAKADVELIPPQAGDYPSTSSGTMATATRLFKYQWDYIHNPKRVWFQWLEKEEEGEIFFTNLVEGIRNTNIQGRNSLNLSRILKEKEIINLALKIPEQLTEIETQIKKYDIHINTRNYIKEIKKDKNEIWLSFFNIDKPDEVGAVIIVKDITKEKEIIEYLRLFDLYVKGDVEYIDDKVIAYISEEPKMPEIELIFNNESRKDITFSYSINYDIKYKYDG